jgi:hypothetical protein
MTRRRIIAALAALPVFGQRRADAASYTPTRCVSVFLPDTPVPHTQCDIAGGPPMHFPLGEQEMTVAAPAGVTVIMLV